MAKNPNNDQNRLGQVEQTDLSESRVNEEFVDWLKKWGNGILLAVLLVALGGVGWQWLERSANERRDAAWDGLTTAELPSSLVEIADEAEGVDSVSILALMQAADKYLTSIQSGTRFDREPGTDEYKLDAETRKAFLDSADELYGKVIAKVGDDYKTTFAKKLYVISALFGQAAIAESRGEIENGKALLARITEIAEPQYPQLAAQAGQRSDSMDVLAVKTSFPAQADLPAPPVAETTPDASALIGTEGVLAPAGAAQEDAATSEDASDMILKGQAESGDDAPSSGEGDG
ncbi:MAG TPA: hypothetical protein DCX60_01580 [Phycisphaerales bacterium]|nr:hypothetical protein [Phycisphaerales bacterium]